jgi:integrase
MMLKMMLDAGVSYRLIAFNGARTYHVGRRVSAKRKRPLVMIPADKIERMRAALLARRQGAPGLTAEAHNLRTVALLSLLAYAGLRPAEALGLKWRDLDELHSELLAGERVANGDEADPKTPTSLRRVPIIAPLMQDLRAWRDVTPFPGAESPMIPSQDGMPFNTQAIRNYSRLIFAPAAKAVGIEKVRLYVLRHTWCMSQIRCGWDLLVLAERAGSSAETIATYYLAKPSLQRDLGIGDDVTSFDEWVSAKRSEANLREIDEAASA